MKKKRAIHEKIINLVHEQRSMNKVEEVCECDQCVNLAPYNLTAFLSFMDKKLESVL